jgi:hypothetical protein
LADVFVSYARDDRSRVAAVARVLEASRFSVYWDRHLPAGQRWRQHLKDEIDKARCVIVVWSTTSVDSDWVLDEAERGREKLLPVRIDSVELPIGFGQIQSLDLRGWGGEHAGDLEHQLVKSVATFLEGIASPPVALDHEPTVTEPPPAVSAPVVSPGKRDIVFISWSGEASRELAGAVNVLLSSVFDDRVNVVWSGRPKGATSWRAEIEDALRRARAVVLVVEEQSLSSTWLQYEAGAVAGQAEAFFVTSDLSDARLRGTPLESIRLANALARSDMLTLLGSLAQVFEDSRANLPDRFDHAWPAFVGVAERVRFKQRWRVWRRRLRLAALVLAGLLVTGGWLYREQLACASGDGPSCAEIDWSRFLQAAGSNVPKRGSALAGGPFALVSIGTACVEAGVVRLVRVGDQIASIQVRDISVHGAGDGVGRPSAILLQESGAIVQVEQGRCAMIDRQALTTRYVDRLPASRPCVTLERLRQAFRGDLGSAEHELARLLASSGARPENLGPRVHDWFVRCAESSSR